MNGSIKFTAGKPVLFSLLLISILGVVAACTRHVGPSAPNAVPGASDIENPETATITPTPTATGTLAPIIQMGEPPEGPGNTLTAEEIEGINREYFGDGTPILSYTQAAGGCTFILSGAPGGVGNMAGDDCFDVFLLNADGGTVQRINGTCFGIQGPATFRAYADDVLKINSWDLQCCGCGWTPFWLTDAVTGQTAQVKDKLQCGAFDSPDCTPEEYPSKCVELGLTLVPIGSVMDCPYYRFATPTPTLTPTVTPTPTETFTPTNTSTPTPPPCVIEGPDTLDFRCANGGESGTLSAQVEQSGGTYNWTVVLGGNAIQINGSSTNPAVTVQAIGAGNATVQLTYTMGSQTFVCVHDLTVNQPAAIVVADPPTITSELVHDSETGQCIGLKWGTLTDRSRILLQVRDQSGDPVPGISVSEQVAVNELQTSDILLEKGIQRKPIITGGGTTGTDGSFVDRYYVFVKDERLCGNQNVQVTLTQVLNVGGCLGFNTVTLSPSNVQTSFPLSLQ